jgi:hypothetical protein
LQVRTSFKALFCAIKALLKNAQSKVRMSAMKVSY